MQDINNKKDKQNVFPSIRLITRIDGWWVYAFVIALMAAVPITVVLSSLFSPTEGIWDHLIAHVLPELLLNTFWLVTGVTTGTLMLGVSLAWLTAVCVFPGSRIFAWALLLPLSMPSYVLAFVFLGLFNFTGPLQTALRNWLGAGNVYFPDISSTGGVITVMSLALYPYVYLLARNAFMTQGSRALEAAGSLGHGKVSGFFRVALPMARPWIAAGVLLVIMEALADFGAVSIFNYNTFTTAIYKAWFGFFSLSAAAQLSSILIIIVFVILLVEQRTRSDIKFTRSGRESAATPKIKLHGWLKWGSFGFAFSVLSAAFIVPVIQLSIWALQVYKIEFNYRYLEFIAHSLLLGIIGAVTVCLFALILSYAKRHHPDGIVSFFTRIATLGYAMPGTVLAVGVFIPVAYLDNILVDLMNTLITTELSSILKGTVPVLIFAYLIRFMAAGFGSIDSAMHRITRSIDEASRLTGLSGLKMLSGIHLPILKNGVITAAIIVFIDIMKEMPITLMMRPFGWDTLAVKIFELTSEGEWTRASLPALTLVLAGIVPVILLSRKGEK